MYEFLALDLGSGRLLTRWGWAAHGVRLVGGCAGRPLPPFRLERARESVDRLLLSEVREGLPGDRFLLRPRHRPRWEDLRHAEHVGAVAEGGVRGGFENGGFGFSVVVAKLD